VDDGCAIGTTAEQEPEMSALKTLELGKAAPTPAPNLGTRDHPPRHWSARMLLARMTRP
jgi:hypothetical protein